jgi:hypothetical protein
MISNPNEHADQAVDAWLAECTDGRVSDHTIMMVRQFAYHALRARAASEEADHG